MEAIPRDLGSGEALSGVACPECPGVLRVHKTDRGRLEFRCRVGHVVSTWELVSAKEGALESRLWAALVAAAELDAVLRDLAEQALPERVADSDLRLVALDRIVGVLRELIEHNEPVRLAGCSQDPKERP
jgi:hypothetical protein